MDGPAVSASTLIDQADVEPFDAAELDGATVVDAFMIFRYQRPDWAQPRAAYVGSTTMGDELQIGLVQMVLDRLRREAESHWMDDE